MQTTYPLVMVMYSVEFCIKRSVESCHIRWSVKHIQTHVFECIHKRWFFNIQIQCVFITLCLYVMYMFIHVSWIDMTKLFLSLQVHMVKVSPCHVINILCICLYMYVSSYHYKNTWFKFVPCKMAICHEHVIVFDMSLFLSLQELTWFEVSPCNMAICH